MKHKAGGIAGRSKTPIRFVIIEEFSQISGSLAIQNLKHVQENFESYPTGNWQPIESFEKWASSYTMLQYIQCYMIVPVKTIVDTSLSYKTKNK